MALEHRCHGQTARADRARTRPDPQETVRVLLPHRARYRALRAQPADPVPGPRLGRQFVGVLRAGRDRDRPQPHGTAVRALHLRRTRRAPGHRHRFRTRAPRGSTAVRIQPLRPRTRRADRRGDQLPWPQRGARRGPRTRPAAGPGQRTGRLPGPLEQPRTAARGAARAWLRPGHATDAAGGGLDQRTGRLPAAPVPAPGRFRDLRAPVVHPGAGGERGHGRPHRDPVGQGRPGRHRADEGGLPGAGHAHRRAQMPGHAARAWRAADGHGADPG
ncbi:hypothetical protein D3C71_1217510 [compost metagenome]